MSDHEIEVNLGPCHYSDAGEAAVAIAVHPHGTGWIPVCERHVPRALADGYEIREHLSADGQ
jgi:hypothetical protein